MTPEAINQAMAELDGWKPTTDGGICWDVNGTPIISYPSYTEDLNAVARVVEKLAWSKKSDYRWNMIEKMSDESFDATADQRCESILRAVGKWVDG